MKWISGDFMFFKLPAMKKKEKYVKVRREELFVELFSVKGVFQATYNMES